MRGMASYAFTSVIDRFPAATVVKAYRAKDFPPGWTGAPPVTEIASATVASDGSLSFTGLADDTAYVAFAVVSGQNRSVKFRTAAAAAGGGVVTESDPVATPLLAGKVNVFTWVGPKTANYAAAAGEAVRCDPTGGAFTVTLPNAPANSTRVAVKITTSTAPNAVTVATAGSDVLNRTGGPTTLTLQVAGQAAVFEYDATGHIWSIVSSDTPIGSLDARYNAAITWHGTEGTALGAAQALTLKDTGPEGLIGKLSADLTVAINSPATGRSFWIDGTQHATAPKRLSLNVGGLGAVEVTDVFSKVPLGANFMLHGQIGPDGTTVHVTVAGATGVGIADIIATGTPDITSYLRGDGTWATPAAAAGAVPLGSYTPITEWRGATLASGAGAANYLLGVGQVNALAAAGSVLGGTPFWLDPADYAGATPVLRFRYLVLTNAVAPGCDFTFGLYKINSFNGASAAIPGIATIGAALATAVVAAPGANTVNGAAGPGSAGASADIAFPGAAGWYALGCLTSAANAANSRPHIQARLAYRLT